MNGLKTLEYRYITWHCLSNKRDCGLDASRLHKHVFKAVWGLISAGQWVQQSFYELSQSVKTPWKKLWFQPDANKALLFLFSLIRFLSFHQVSKNLLGTKMLKKNVIECNMFNFPTPLRKPFKVILYECFTSPPHSQWLTSTLVNRS